MDGGCTAVVGDKMRRGQGRRGELWKNGAEVSSGELMQGYTLHNPLHSVCSNCSNVCAKYTTVYRALKSEVCNV